MDKIDSPLGKATQYPEQYDPSLLYAIPREPQRQALGLMASTPFYGEDIWNAYELSWLDTEGKPQVFIAELRVPCNSPSIVESKSLKLYFNSYNQTRYTTTEDVQQQISHDLSQCVQAPVTVSLQPLEATTVFAQLPGDCLDQYPLAAAPKLQLQPEQGQVQQQWYSHLLKSNCPVTGQPDWASLYIAYAGVAIQPSSLLSYIVSYRQHDDFHEHCVEQIFIEIWRQCQPQALTVYARYTRRGGIDINPYRSSREQTLPNWRLSRQ